MSPAKQYLSEPLRDVPDASAGGLRCPSQPFKLEKTSPDWCGLTLSLLNICLTYFQVPAILKQWSRLDSGFEASAQAYKALSTYFKDKTNDWAKEDQNAQAHRYSSPSAMDIYETAKEKGLLIQFDISHPF